jgi:hypothetical protein
MPKTLLVSPARCKTKQTASTLHINHYAAQCILKLLKAIHLGFLKGFPNLTAVGVTKYLNPSPATAKGHMKRSQMGIRSTRRVVTPAPIATELPDNPSDIKVLSHDSSIINFIRPPNANLIKTDNGSSGANIFCFATFADKQTGILYNYLTGLFPFMSLEGNVCFLIVYHYKTNTIDVIIFEAYKQQITLFKSKRYKIKLNVMDNQAMQVIKKFLN